MLPQVQPGRDGRRRLSLILYLDYLPSFASPLCDGMPWAVIFSSYHQLPPQRRRRDARKPASKHGEGNVKIPR